MEGWRTAVEAFLVVLLSGCAAAVLAEAGDLPEMVVRVQAVQVSDDDGGRAADITPAEVARWVDMTNEVWAAAGIRFVFDSADGDFSDLRSTLLNDLQSKGYKRWVEAVAAGNREAARHPGKVTLLFRHGTGPAPLANGFASTDYDFIVMPGFRPAVYHTSQGTTALAHEMGHYLGLLHTFGPEFKTVAAAEAKFRESGMDPAVFDNDHLADTPPDPLIDTLHGASEDYVVLDGVRLPIPRDNIMSYWDSPSKTLTPMQVADARRTLATRAQGNMFLPVNAGSSTRVEAESLLVEVTAASGGDIKVSFQDMAPYLASRWSGGIQLRCSGSQELSVSLRFPQQEAGRVRVQFYGTRAPDYGCVQFYVCDVPLGEPLDLFAPTVQPTGRIDLGEVSLGGEPGKIRVEVVSRNERSRGWGFGLDAFEFTPVR